MIQRSEGPLIVAIAGEGDGLRRRARAERRGDDEARVRRGMRGDGRGMGLRLRVRGGAPGRGLYMPLSTGGSNGRGRSGEVEGRWVAWSFGRPGRSGCHRAGPYRAVPRAGTMGRGGGPSTKRPSGRAGTKHYSSSLRPG